MIYLNDKKIAVIGIDHGYGNIKTANTITPTAITEYDTEPVFSGNILVFDGKYYRIGEGHKEFIVNKAMDEDLLDDMSCYLASTGKTYQNYEAALRSWARRSKDSCAAVSYEYKEGESL